VGAEGVLRAFRAARGDETREDPAERRIRANIALSVPGMTRAISHGRKQSLDFYRGPDCKTAERGRRESLDLPRERRCPFSVVSSNYLLTGKRLFGFDQSTGRTRSSTRSCAIARDAPRERARFES
jgi:hypothetical protein